MLHAPLAEVPKTTLEEIKALKIAIPDRTYCLDELADYYKCYYKNAPFLSYYCSHQRHHYFECEHGRCVEVLFLLGGCPFPNEAKVDHQVINPFSIFSATLPA